jgi:hypothetical protein
MKTKVWSGVDVSKSVCFESDLVIPKHDLGKWIGVELEFISEEYTADFVAYLEDNGAFCIDVKDDGSISSQEIEDGNAYPTEFAVLTHVDDMQNLRTAIEVAKDRGGYVNASCGLHVHLDMRHKTKAEAYNIAQRLKRALPLLRGVVAPYRLKSKYCRKAIAGKDDRYAAINFHAAYERHKTIEIRLHQGSLDFAKIKNWIKLLYKISQSEVLDYKPERKLLLNVLSLPRSLNNYVNNRTKTMKLLKHLEPSEVSRYTEVDVW